MGGTLKDLKCQIVSSLDNRWFEGNADHGKYMIIWCYND